MRSTQVALRGWKPLVDTIKTEKRYGAHRNTFGSRAGKQPRWEKKYGRREGYSPRHDSQFDGVRVGGGGVFGDRLQIRNLDRWSKDQLERYLYGLPNITNLRRFELHTHPDLSMVATAPKLSFNYLFMIDGDALHSKEKVLNRFRSEFAPLVAQTLRAPNVTTLQLTSATHSVVLRPNGDNAKSIDPDHVSRCVDVILETSEAVFRRPAKPEELHPEEGYTDFDPIPLFAKTSNSDVSILGSSEPKAKRPFALPHPGLAPYDFTIQNLTATFFPGRNTLDALDQLTDVEPLALKLRHAFPTPPAMQKLLPDACSVDEVLKWHFFHSDPRSHFADVIGHERPLPVTFVVHPAFTRTEPMVRAMMQAFKSSGFQHVYDNPHTVHREAMKWSSRTNNSQRRKEADQAWFQGKSPYGGGHSDPNRHKHESYEFRHLAIESCYKF